MITRIAKTALKTLRQNTAADAVFVPFTALSRKNGLYPPPDNSLISNMPHACLKALHTRFGVVCGALFCLIFCRCAIFYIEKWSSETISKTGQDLRSRKSREKIK